VTCIKLLELKGKKEIVLANKSNKEHFVIGKIHRHFHIHKSIMMGNTIVGGEEAMSKKSSGRGQKAPSVNPQGYGKDVEFSTEPKSELQNLAKKSNTK